MRPATAFFLALALALAAAASPAQTLRWASQGDLQTTDPHSQNESLTNALNSHVYETLVVYGKQLEFLPGLATEWTRVEPTLWRFKLRPGVRFHDGTPFSADDVVFSAQRAAQGSSDLKVYADALGEVRKVDALTVEFRQPKLNPIFLNHLATVFVMSKAWCEQHRATRPLDFKAREEGHASRFQNGTGPFVLVSRQPNVQDVSYTPVRSDATRSAALISGELDLVLDPAPQDIPRLRRTPGVKVVDGLENRILFIGMDQSRERLLYGKVPGDRNPFKDLRVRRALYHAIDIETIRTKLMRGQSAPTGGLTPSPQGTYNDPALERRLPHDVAAARKLMAEAGYPQGFEVTLDCPNNRYINDEEICLALAAMWSQVGVKVKVNAMPRSLYFPKVQRYDTSMYLLGWGGATTDAEIIFTPVMRSRGEGGVGVWNFGGASNPRFDELAAASAREPDAVKRQALVKAALAEYQQQVHLIPLHRQVIPWAARSNVDLVHRPDNWLVWPWVTLR
jgi:peptide/nickel transport system substrate-binding protein